MISTLTLWALLLATALIGFGLGVALMRSSSRPRTRIPHPAAKPHTHSKPSAAAAAAAPPESLPQQKNWMLGVQGSVQGKTFHLGYREVILGRSNASYIHIYDSRASREHASLIGSPTGVLLVDLGSQNGTRLNGHALKPHTPYPLKAGDRVAIGADVLEFQPQAKLAVNHALALPKPKTQSLHRPTMMVSMDERQIELLKVMLDTGGDIEKAARIMDLSVEEAHTLLPKPQSRPRP